MDVKELLQYVALVALLPLMACVFLIGIRWATDIIKGFWGDGR